MPVKQGFRKNGAVETRKNAKVYITDLLDTRRQRLGSMLENKYVSPYDYDKELREIQNAFEIVKEKL